jgi:hypothetical protein
MTDVTCLDRSAPGPAVPAADASARERAATEEGTPVLCASCGGRVTDTQSAIRVGEAHEHTFVNPAGIIYRVRCFSDAPGCSELGELTEEFTWFAGFAWRYAFCASCAEHLGWSYRSGGGAGFYGLVAERLAEGRAS